MSTETQWIDGNKRLPENKDMPVWCCRDGNIRLEYSLSFRNAAEFFWQPAVVPEPPKLEPTQADVDAAFAINLKNLWGNTAYIPRCDILRVVEKALAWERAGIKAMLEETSIERTLTRGVILLEMTESEWERLAKRVGLSR